MRWDIFCQVIDNFGDIGVCWRLSADLASRGEQVRLWVDDASALAWMAPGGHVGVEVRLWTKPLDAAMLTRLPVADVWVEAFGCELPGEFTATLATPASPGTARPVWINLEYLSAETYVERNHALPSPAREIPVAGGVKWFYYPGFTPRTGGLLREPTLLTRQAGFDRHAWLTALWPGLVHAPSFPPPGAAATAATAARGKLRRVALFCYEPAALPAMFAQLQAGDAPTHLLVTAGRATQAVQALCADRSDVSAGSGRGHLLSISYLPTLTQSDFDHLLWACDLNFVRGEDSLVRAIWAGQPFVWQAYPQHDGAHHGKLEAFLDWLQAPESLRRAHRAWNGADPAAALPDLAGNLAGWRDTAQAARSRALAPDDLASQLLQFVLEKR